MNNSTAELLDDAVLEAAAQSITPLPANTSRLVMIASEPDAALGDVVDIVKYDPVLTGAVLGQANAAYSVVMNRITNARDAVVRLGIDTVVTIAIRTAVASTMNEDLALYDLEGRRLYRHAVLSAVAGEVLRANHPVRIPPLTATVALLHDIGKVVLSRAVGSRAVELVSALAANDARPRHELEADVFGLHHGHAGRYAIQAWKLPSAFLEGIVNHHCDIESPSMFARSVQLADELAHLAERLLDPTTDPGRTPAAPDRPDLLEAATSLGIEAPALTAIAEVTAMRYEAIAPSLAL